MNMFPFFQYDDRSSGNERIILTLAGLQSMLTIQFKIAGKHFYQMHRAKYFLEKHKLL